MKAARKLVRTLLCVALCSIALATALRAADVPYLSGRVVDGAEMLAPADEQRIAARLEKLERETGAQVVVLTVPTLDGVPVEDYAMKVAETWKLGRKGVDDGVVFLIAREEHALRLEVGYGLESKLPDITGKRILDELVVPRLREGDFAGGVDAGLDAVEKAVRGGDPLPPPKQRAIGGGGGSPFSPSGVLMGIVFLLFIVPFATSALYSSGAGAWILYGILTPFLAAFPLAAFGLPGLAVPLIWLVGFPILRRRIQRAIGRGGFGGRPQPRRRGSGWWGSGGMGGWGGMGGGLGGGGFGGGGFGGGGFSGGGGGFSGGGGSFGGGGASSHW
ncbi:MAG TPA: TPM domain-containing protein [Thermoanaerobaculia bacterium]|nr:TPM domain-containing protein [Thermoanaerobaculia bacterium]